MLVDLGRNDVGKVAAAGSVRVRRGFGVRAWLRAPCAGGSRRQPPKLHSVLCCPRRAAATAPTSKASRSARRAMRV